MISHSRRAFLQSLLAFPAVVRAGEDWPRFRGVSARGVTGRAGLPTSWNADPAAGPARGIRWRAPVPGLGHGSPILWGDRIYLPTAVAKNGAAPIKLTPGGEPTAADDQGEQEWVVLCFDAASGEEVWRRTAHAGLPRATRHAKATHSNTTLATDGKRLVAFFGSEGVHCYDLAGERLWSKDLGVVDVSKYGVGWGYASSPSLHGNRLVLVCDDPNRPFLVCLDLSNGDEIWRVDRAGVCERSWGTPLILESRDRTQVVVNGWPWIVSYSLADGRELWRIEGGGDNPAPSPFLANGWIYITNAHGGPSPIYVVRPDASGLLTAESDAVVWSLPRGGSYMSTPVVYGDLLYFGNTNGVVRCFEARTGESVYQARLDSDASIYASLIAGDGKIYCPAENGSVYVLRAGPEFELLSRNSMGAACFATPVVTDEAMVFRTTSSLIAVDRSA
jgi:outer membrane protein assembly factor BamB